MASPVFSPIHPHFFQPLLPGFHRHLTVPVAFFMRHIKGKDEPKVAELRSGRRERGWKVKMEGRRFTHGWEEFAVAHGLKAGDVLLFRHGGGLVFHVTAFGPSCCEIQYAPFIPEDDDDDDDVRNMCRKKQVKFSRKTEADPSDHTCFRAVVTPSGLLSDILYIPTSFAWQNGLNNRKGGIVLMNRHGRSWKLDLRHKKLSGRVYARKGWRDFCNANGQRVGDFFRLKLVQNGATPVLRMLPAEPINYSNVNSSREYLKTELKKKLSEKPGCKSRKSSGECSKIEVKKTHSGQGVSRSPRENRFVTLTLTPSSFHRTRLVNGLDKRGQKITLLGKDGRWWPTCQRLEKWCGRVIIGKGWREFCVANDIKIGELFTLELIREDTGPLLKLCSKF